MKKFKENQLRVFVPVCQLGIQIKWFLFTILSYHHLENDFSLQMVDKRTTPLLFHCHSFKRDKATKLVLVKMLATSKKLQYMDNRYTMTNFHKNVLGLESNVSFRLSQNITDSHIPILFGILTTRRYRLPLRRHSMTGFSNMDLKCHKRLETCLYVTKS